MRAFAELYRRLDETNRTNRKVAALVDYFRSVEAAEAAWAIWFLSGRRPKRLLKVRQLVAWCCEEAGVSDWMFGECYDVVGDLAEAMALLLPATTSQTAGHFHEWVEQRLLPIRHLDESAQREAMRSAWRELDPQARLVWNKLITGSFRVGVSQLLVVRALAEVSGVPVDVIAHRLMGDWSPSAEFYRSVTATGTAAADLRRPYPFCLAHPLEGDVLDLEPIGEWLIEWKWDGIRAQLLRRGLELVLWSRGEELLTERFPDLHAEALELPDNTVLDGEIVGWKDGQVLPFGNLQTRINRKSLSKKLLAAVPVRFIVFDVLEVEGADIRTKPLIERRSVLERLLSADHERLMLSPREFPADWAAAALLRQESRPRHVEGLMLKRLDSEYAAGRPKGVWWKWKIEPYTADCVLIYAQHGSGKRAALYTDYTFGVWHEGQLVPFAKAYSGLTDEEIRQVDRFVRENTLEKFGPVRVVRPQLVFELGFEGLQRSTRHKSGIAVRFPRMLRWRTDKRPEEADTLETLRTLLP